MFKKTRLTIYLLLVGILCAVIISGCGGSGQQAAQKETPTSESGKDQMLITIGTATVGGAWYPMGGALANVISNYVPNVKANAIPTGASIENLKSISSNKMEIGFATTDIPYQMYRGIDFEENKSFLALANNDYIYLALIVKKDSPIKTFTDIKGKKIGTGVPGSSNYKIVEEVLKAHGMTYNDVKPYPSGVSEQCEALKDGNIDMFAYVVSGSGGAAPAIVELATTTDIRFISLDEEILQKINKEKPYYLIRDIPPGWVKGLNERVKALAVGTTICVKADLKDELVYNICKAMFEHKNELDAVHPQWKQTTKETVALDLPVPLHPGAEKYYKEIGAPIRYIE
ncbi:MAG: TAXI family TRAP transporter solute-binding subunit [Armatimonadetes bacterium]|nr:TAXI family TRAP transporter solute-binding subunit [Armatimonadota bacterium]